MYDLDSFGGPIRNQRWSTVKRISDRALAPLQPMFVAMAADWTAAVQPHVVLRAIVFSALLAEERSPEGRQGGVGLPERADDEADVRWFLGLGAAGERIDSTALADGQRGLFTNQVVRAFVRTVVAAARTADPGGASRTTENVALIDAWTS